MLLNNTFRAFRHRDYLIFWSGLFFGHTATLVQATAQAWLIFQLTESAFYLSLKGLCLGLPRVLFSALGGAIVDRADRRLIFAATQTAFLLMALFLGVFDYLGMIRVWHLLVISALTGFFVSSSNRCDSRSFTILCPVPNCRMPLRFYQMIFNGSALRIIDWWHVDSVH